MTPQKFIELIAELRKYQIFESIDSRSTTLTIFAYTYKLTESDFNRITTLKRRYKFELELTVDRRDIKCKFSFKN